MKRRMVRVVCYAPPARVPKIQRAKMEMTMTKLERKVMLVVCYAPSARMMVAYREQE